MGWLEKVQAIPHNIWYSGPVRRVVGWTKKVYLPGFEGLPLHDVAVFFVRGLQKGAIVTRASSVSFTLLLALLPTGLLLLSLISYIPIENIHGQLLAGFADLLPQEVMSFVEHALEELVGRKHSTVLSIGFLLTVYYASNSINAILVSFNSSYHITLKRNPFKQRLIALRLIIVLAVLLLVGITLLLFSNFFFDYLRDNHYAEGDFLFAILYISKWILIILMFVLSISVLYNVGDTDRKSWRVVTAGSTLATTASITVSWLFAYYVTHYGNYNEIYGSLGTVIVMLLWIYFNSLILLIGFELNTSIHTAKIERTKVYDELMEKEDVLDLDPDPDPDLKPDTDPEPEKNS